MGLTLDEADNRGLKLRELLISEHVDFITMPWPPVKYPDLFRLEPVERSESYIGRLQKHVISNSDAMPTIIRKIKVVSN